MKCEKCGFTPNPGDTVCINCGNKLNVENAVMPGIESIVKNLAPDKKGIKPVYILVIVLAVLAVALGVFLVLNRRG